VSDAPIRLQGKAIDHVFESPNEILSSVKNYYVNETLKQVYKIIGSLDFVGNPTILFSSFVSGVRDLVVAPTKAFLKSPTNVKKVGMGFGKGTLSFFSNGASGIFGFSARLWATAGQTVAVLSLDAEYRQWHRDRIVNEAANLNRVWKRRGVQSLQEIVLRPFADVAIGIALGATGFFSAPYKGAKKGGTRGFAQGLAVGTIGVVAKPVVGVFDAFTHASQTVHDLAKSVNVLERRYQPALKLRLPYVFGPMNILTPFDPVSAQSRYLLNIFPPRTKLKRRVHLGKEILVHSEVLSMEPGIQTYVIATTIRVLLIKLRRDNNNAIVPSFGWEVDLSSSARVSSTVSDHGHNGVALTITKRAQPEATKPKASRRNSTRKEKQNLETTIRSTASSAANVSSMVSIGSSEFSEAEEEVFGLDDVGEDLHTSRDSYGLEESKITTSLPETESGDATYQHVATTEQGEILEWYTVLAEYQFRKPLTRLSNAISCIVGDYDAVTTDRLRGGHRATRAEGTVAFGIFNFEKGLPDGRSAMLSNMELVRDLESLSWMTQTLFERVRVVPSTRRKDFLTRIRRNWGYSKDLEASVALGGPAWLIEQRARAMHISRGKQDGQSFDEDDRVIQDVLNAEMDQGTVTSDIALDLVKRMKEYDTGSSTIDTSKRDGFKERRSMDTEERNLEHSAPDDVHSITSENNILDQAEDDDIMSGQLTTSKRNGGESSEDKNEDTTPSPHRRPLLRPSMHRDSDGDIFFSMRNLGSSFESDDSEEDDDDDDEEGADEYKEVDVAEAAMAQQYHLDHDTTVTDVSELAHEVEEQQEPHSGTDDINDLKVRATVSPVEVSSHSESQNPSMRSDGVLLAARKKETKLKSTPFRKNAAARSVQSVDISETSDATSRIDRLESVMEQLVLLNASQMQQQQQMRQMDTSHHSESSSAVHELADTLKQELKEIRSQIDVRAKEDEALRNEISLLRDQLEDRRSKRNKKSPENNKGKSDRGGVASKVRKFPVPEIRLKTMLPRRLVTSDDRVTNSGTTTVPASNQGRKAAAAAAAAGATSGVGVAPLKNESSESKSFTGKASAENRSVGWDESIDLP
jgi:regulator of replication initiation timing